MANIKHISYYTNVMQQWSKPLGAKPSEAQLALAHVFGRPGKQSFAVAMALRDGGVTGGQIKLASSLFDGKATPQLNHMRALIDARLFTRESGVPGYKLVKGPKAAQFIELYGAKATEGAGKAAAKGDKPRAAAKAAGKRKAKAATPVAAVVETPTSEASSVNEGATA